MSRVYIHNNKKIDLLRLLFLLFIPFFFLGIYKNGFLVYKYTHEILDLVKPILFLIISLIIALLYKIIKKEKFLNYNLLCNVLISILVMPNINLLLYLIVIICVNLIVIFIKKDINIIPIFMLVSIVLNHFIYKVPFNQMFLNIYESSINHDYSFIDYLIGKGPGGIGTSFLIMSLISFIILYLLNEYKKEIPVVSIITYFILNLAYLFITSSLTLNSLINNNVIFAFLFVASISIYSPYSKGGYIIYSVLIGLLTFILSFIDLNIAMYLSILIANILSKYIDKFVVKKSTKNLIDII